MLLTVVYRDNPMSVAIDQGGNLADLKSAIENLFGVAISEQKLFINDSPITGIFFIIFTWISYASHYFGIPENTPSSFRRNPDIILSIE